MSEPNPAVDHAVANPGTGGVSFAGWTIAGFFWPLMRLAFGTDRNSYEVDDVVGQRLPVLSSQRMSLGLDYSVAQVTLPNIGAAFSGGVYDTYALLATIPANTNRIHVEVQNNSANRIVIMRDDGTAANAAPPVHASAFALTPIAQGDQGAAWSSNTFRGRIQIFGPVGTTQIVAFED